MGRISNLAASYYGANVLQKNAFCVGYTRALNDVVTELSDAPEHKDVQQLMLAWFHDAEELLQELQEMQ